MNQTGFFPLSKHKPVFLLQAEAYVLGNHRASMATDELVDRFGNGAIGKDAMDRLNRTALSRHAQTWRVFPEAQWQLIVAEVLRNRVPVDRIEQLYEDCIAEFGIDKKAIESQRPYPGERIRITEGADFRIGPVRPSLYGFEFGRRLSVRFLDDKGEQKSMTADWDASASIGLFGVSGRPRSGGMEYRNISVEAPHYAGTYTCIIEIEYDFLEHVLSYVVSKLSEEDFARLGTLKESASFTCTIEVVEKGTDDPPIVTAEELELRPDQLIRIRMPETVISSTRMVYGIPDVIPFKCAIGTAPRLDPTIGLGGYVVFTQNDTERRIPIVYHNPHELVDLSIPWLEMFDPGTVSVRYEHAPDIARRNGKKMDRVLGGSVELGTITVVRPAPVNQGTPGTVAPTPR